MAASVIAQGKKLLGSLAADRGMVHMKPVQTCRVTKPWRLLPTFQQQAQEARQCLTVLESLEAALEKAMCEAVKMKSKPQWRCQEHGMTAKKSCRQ